MGQRRNQTRESRGVASRRTVLAAVGATVAGVGALTSTHGTFATDAGRTSGVALANDTDAYVGLDRSTSVKKNSREPLVYIDNPLSSTQTVTVTINNCADDILYNPSDEQATCQITGTVGPGDTGRFDIEAQKVRTVNFTIDADSIQLSLNADRSVEVVAGNDKGAVFIQKFKGLTADTANDEWTIDDIFIKDDDGDDDLDRVEFEVQDGNSNTVATETKYCGWNNSGSNTVDCKNGASYNPNGNPNVTIQPDDSSYDVTNQTYQATVFGYDADGNFDTDTVTTNE